jgi:hypothetical protein
MSYVIEPSCWNKRCNWQLASQSVDVAAFAAYEPVVDAIRRAKAGEISVPEELPGMRYWLFETDMPAFKTLGDAFARFHLILRGLED